MLSEWYAGLFQGIITMVIAIVCWLVYRRYRRRDFLWWSLAWSLHVDLVRLTGRVMQRKCVRAFSPFINLYAAILLIGGAIFSALRFRSMPDKRGKYVGNIVIAIGALLPGIGGTFTRFGHVEVLYVTEFVGLLLIYAGYRLNIRPAPDVARSAESSLELSAAL